MRAVFSGQDSQFALPKEPHEYRHGSLRCSSVAPLAARVSGYSPSPLPSSQTLPLSSARARAKVHDASTPFIIYLCIKHRRPLNVDSTTSTDTSSISSSTHWNSSHRPYARAPSRHGLPPCLFPAIALCAAYIRRLVCPRKLGSGSFYNIQPDTVIPQSAGQETYARTSIRHLPPAGRIVVNFEVLGGLRAAIGSSIAHGRTLHLCSRRTSSMLSQRSNSDKHVRDRHQQLRRGHRRSITTSQLARAVPPVADQTSSDHLLLPWRY
ncbi:hypothetical protein FA95DRAFT_916044 [Auriscalpium vulgare]|uniref:Uncharacterized protein n=1 Tax=Auriscalpium vulgare TaxID=40419 RepID=A0ACB8R821_9AGAM|nr:hypothetical protein FA95DRAFT_916044 [Auriscalpium vulgare]